MFYEKQDSGQQHWRSVSKFDLKGSERAASSNSSDVVDLAIEAGSVGSVIRRGAISNSSAVIDLTIKAGSLPSVARPLSQGTKGYKHLVRRSVARPLPPVRISLNAM